MKKEIMRLMQICMAIGLVAVFAAFVAGCTPPAGEEAGTATEEGVPGPKVDAYKIGAIFSVTGKASFLGDPEKKTVEMLAKKLNDAGGINGIPVEVIIEDDAGSEEKTKTAAARLIDMENVLVILGPSRSGNTMAIKDMMAEKQVPLLSCAAAEAIVNPVNEWVFKTPQKDSFVAEHILVHMKEHGISKIAVLYGNTGFGQLGLKQIQAFSDQYGVQVVMAEAYQPAATESDLETLLTKVKAEGSIQAIVNWSILPAQSVVPKKMKELGMDNIKLYHSHGFGNIKYVKDAGAAADGIIFPAGRLLVANQLDDTNPQKAELVKYIEEYESNYPGEVTSTFGGHAYDAFKIAVMAIEKAGADKAAIRKEIEKIQGFAGTGGVFNFSPQDHNGLDMNSLEFLTVKNGQFAIYK